MISERIASLAKDIKNHLPSRLGLDDKDLLKLARYLFGGYIFPHESVYVDDKHKIEKLEQENANLRKALEEIIEKAEVDKTSGGGLARACVFSIQLTAQKALNRSSDGEGKES